MHSIQYFQNIIKQEFAKQNFFGEPEELYNPIDYALSLGGKRIRPVLTLMACELFDGDINEALAPAMGLEIFHNFTLLHDDVMDKSPIRRGKPTIFKKWNTNTAILSGDAMLIQAYSHITKTHINFLPDVLKIFNKTAIEVCEGQQYDMNYETSENITIEDYFKMIRLKTAVLIAACLKIGAIIGGASKIDAENIYKFGENIGIAFQLKDDLLDAFGDTVKFGKNTGNDIVTNKKTFLFLKAFELAKGDVLDDLKHSFLIKDENEKKINKVTEIYKKLNIQEITEKEISYYYQKALTNLSAINVEDNRKKELKNFAENLKKRDF